MSDFLFASGSFLAGMGSVIDLGGTMLQFNESRNEREADALALHNDITAVSKDIRAAVQEATS